MPKALEILRSCKLTTVESLAFFSTNALLLHPHGKVPSRSIKMSWMDSWSRPSKSQATPAPFYLLPSGEATPYCHSCGRVIGSRRQVNAANSTPVKYCSTRCRSQKPGKLDREIEDAFVRLLNGQEDPNVKGGGVGRSSEGKGAGATKSQIKGLKDTKKKQKGDPRILVPCSAVERLVFGHHGQDSENDDSHSEPEEPNQEVQQHLAVSDDANISIRDLDDPAGVTAPHTDGDVLARTSVRSGTRIRHPQSVSEVNGSVGGEKGRAERIEETDEMLEKRKKGQRRAKEREMVRCAARRGVIVGFAVKSEDSGVGQRRNAEANEDESKEVRKRKCEAVVLGKVVEPSFAKGDWAIRWRE